MTDRVLDRVPSVPDRRRQVEFNLADAIVGLTPRSYTWSVPFCLDQRAEGACVAHGATHEAVARPVMIDFAKHPMPDWAMRANRVRATAGTAQQIAQAYAFDAYDWCRRNDEWSGEAYSGTSVAAGAKSMVVSGFWGEYRWTNDVNDLAVAVSRTGPAVIGVDWLTGFFNVDSDGYLNLTGKVEGGHCVLVHGFNVKRQAFLLRNSWGPSWGIKGGAWVRAQDLGVLMQRGGEACLPVRRTLRLSLMRASAV